MKVGYIGLGIMGRACAANVLRAGHTLFLYARRPDTVSDLLAQGAQLCASPAELAAQVEVVVTNVSDTPDVEQVLLGEHGVIHGAHPGLVAVDMSTIKPLAAKAMAAQLAIAGVDFLDAPVSGGEVGAINGTLTIMVGGKAEALERVRPVLQAMGKTITHIGESGAGQVAKACNQMLMVNAIQAAAEAMRLAAAHGLDLLRVREALAGGSAGSKVLDVMGGRMARRDFVAGIQARLHHKDFAMLMDEARQLGAPLPVAAQTWQQLNALMALGGGRMDTSSLLKVLEAPVEKMQ